MLAWAAGVPAGAAPSIGVEGQLADPDKCEYAHHRKGHQPKPGIRGCGLLVGGDDGSPTAESQNVVPLMSTINTGAGAFGLFYGAARRIPSTTRRSAPSPRLIRFTWLLLTLRYLPPLFHPCGRPG